MQQTVEFIVISLAYSPGKRLWKLASQLYPLNCALTTNNLYNSKRIKHIRSMSAPEKNNLLAIPFDSLKTKDKNNKKNPNIFHSQMVFHYLIFGSKWLSGFCEKINMARIMMLSLQPIYLITIHFLNHSQSVIAWNMRVLKATLLLYYYCNVKYSVNPKRYSLSKIINQFGLNLHGSASPTALTWFPGSWGVSGTPCAPTCCMRLTDLILASIAAKQDHT